MFASLADLIADAARNAIEADARRVSVTLVEDDSTIAVSVVDDGKGMDDATRRRAFDPFFTEPGKHDGRTVGLGLAFLKQTCEACGGACSLASAPGVGTTLECRLDARHVDRPPTGDVAAAVTTLFNCPGAFELVFTHQKDDKSYSASRTALAASVGGLLSVGGLAQALAFLRAQEDALNGQTGPHLAALLGK